MTTITGHRVDTQVLVPHSHAASTTTPADSYRRADVHMRRGRMLVTAGFVTAVVGIVAYCIVCFRAGVDQELGAYLLARPEPLILQTLSVIGLGTLLWLAGSLMYLRGAMEADPSRSDNV